jgi:uncharacterized protein (TIGR03435 family)
MPRTLAQVSLLAALTTGAFAQTADAPKFLVADIHTSPHNSLPAMRGPFFGDDRYEIRFATMVDLVHTAYGVDPERVEGGPSWLEYNRYDVMAIAPKNSTPQQRKLMLQSLLADRFQLKFHNENRPTPAYKLMVGKGSKLQESSGGETGCNFRVDQGPPTPPPAPGEPRPPIQLPVFVYTCKGTTMAAFAGTLGAAPTVDQIFNNKPLVDATELPGAYDFTLRFTPQVPRGFEVKGEPIPLMEALDKQLGLKAELGTAPLPAVVVDSANEKATENPPEVAKSFPPIPEQFDVAEIKPAANGPQGQPEIKNGRVIITGITLQNLVWLAWDITPADEIVGAPSWLNSEKFDLIAKAPDGVAMGDLTPTAGSRRSIPINIDALRPMLRNLLVERFKMKVHKEDRPTTSYTLVAVKPKLTKADPNTRTKWMEGPGPDGKDPRGNNPALGRLVTCRNMSMAQFAKLLQEIAGGYIHNDLVDATGLEGGWDFTFYFSAIGQLQGGGDRRGGDAPSPEGASDPTGALSLLDALPKQLGLKLEMQKRPLPVLVIDHIEQKPTDN